MLLAPKTKATVIITTHPKYTLIRGSYSPQTLAISLLLKIKAEYMDISYIYLLITSTYGNELNWAWRSINAAFTAERNINNLQSNYIWLEKHMVVHEEKGDWYVIINQD